MSDRTPADVIAEAVDRWDTDMRWYIVAAGPPPGPVHGYVMRALAAAGFRVVPIPDDNTRADAEAIVWALNAPTSFGPTTRKRAADLLAAAYLDGQPQDQPDRCPNPECDEGVIRPSGNCGFDDDGAMLEIRCSDSWHVGGSGDTR